MDMLEDFGKGPMIIVAHQKKPGRVVTLVPCKKGHCDGVAYLVSQKNANSVLQQLDYREKNGYEKLSINLEISNNTSQIAVTYVAKENNHAFLGSAPMQSIASQIISSSGPSGENKDYLFELATALRNYNFIDEHIFELESLVKNLERAP